MRFSSIVLTAAIALCLSQQAIARCYCAANQGPQECCTCQEIVPRPQPKHAVKAGISSAYKSIGDSCSCGHTVVQPAVPPKPLTNSLILQSPAAIGCQEKTMRAPETFQGPNISPSLVYGNKPEYKPLPADAVSLSLAYQLARSLRRPVPEDQIQYGFRVQPLNAQTKTVSNSNIAEEKLWSINRAVVELKAAHNIGNLDDITDEDELEEKEAQRPGYLTYGDIGYCPEKYPSKTFNLKLPNIALGGALCTDIAHHVPGGSPCGYKSGSIKVNDVRYMEHRLHRGIEDCYDEHK